MVALLRHQPIAVRPRPALRVVAGDRAGQVDLWGRQAEDPDTEESFGAVAGVGRPRLELLPGGPGAVAWPSVGVIAVLALVVFGLFGLVRVAQGSPAGPAEIVGPEIGAVDAVPAPGDRVIVASQGDSLWSIAVGLSPDGDPRPVVAALIEANGGETLRIGQQIVIPSHLLD